MQSPSPAEIWAPTRQLHRPPERIDRIVGLIGAIWSRYPHFSLGELLFGVAQGLDRHWNEITSRPARSFDPATLITDDARLRERLLEMADIDAEAVQPSDSSQSKRIFTPIQLALLGALRNTWRSECLTDQRLGQLIFNALAVDAPDHRGEPLFGDLQPHLVLLREIEDYVWEKLLGLLVDNPLVEPGDAAEIWLDWYPELDHYTWQPDGTLARTPLKRQGTTTT